MSYALGIADVWTGNVDRNRLFACVPSGRREGADHEDEYRPNLKSVGTDVA